jgi:prevent-host-death family protein
MSEVTVRDLRNHGGDVVERVLRGECLTVTRGGRPVAELRPLSRPGVEAATLLQRWRNLPTVDPDRLRRDIDAVIDHDPQGNLRNGPCRHLD